MGIWFEKTTRGDANVSNGIICLCGLFIRKCIICFDYNPGTANAFMYGGFWCGLFTLLFDLLKGFIPVYQFMHYGNAVKVDPFMAALVIAAPVIGQCCSIPTRCTARDWQKRSTTSI